MAQSGYLRVAVAFILCLVLAACTPVGTATSPPGSQPASTGGTPATSPPTGEPVSLRVASDNLPPAPVLRCGMELMKTELAGVIDVEVFDSAQLGQANAVLRLVQAGEFEAAMVGAGQLQAFYAPIGIFSAIYVIDGHEHANRVWDSDVGDDLRAGLAEVSLVPQAFYWYGTRQLTSNKPIRSPADMAGVKLRVSPGSQVAFVNGTAMGGNPTTLPFGELYLALSQGLVDAQENPLPTIDEAKFYEVQDYLNITNHEPSPQFLVLSKAFVDSLTADQKAALDAATEKAEAAVQDCTLKAEADLLAKWKAENTWSGGIIEDVDIAAFRAAAEPILLEEYSEVWGELDLYTRIRDLAGS
jgi:tripartite ATP-independent transporter DctP family solute receptor